MAEVESIKYSSDYQKITIRLSELVSNATLHISYCIEENTPLSYISCNPIELIGISTIEVNVASDMIVPVDGSNTYPFANGLADGIYKFELVIGEDTLTEIRLFARDVKNIIYKMLLNSTYPRKSYDDLWIDEIFMLFGIYKGLVYNAVAGQEENVMNILKDLKQSCLKVSSLIP